MLRRQNLKELSILFFIVSLTGCAMAMADKQLGDKKATHDDDQYVDIYGADDDNFSKDVE